MIEADLFFNGCRVYCGFKALWAAPRNYPIQKWFTIIIIIIIIIIMQNKRRIQEMIHRTFPRNTRMPGETPLTDDRAFGLVRMSTIYKNDM